MTNEIVSAGATMEIERKNEFKPITGYANTFDLDTEEGKTDTLRYINDSESLSQHVGEVLHIVDIITMPGVRKGRNGMPDQPCQDTYLIDIDGIGYFSQASGVERSINAILAMFPRGGHGTKKGYIAISCVEKQLSNGNTMKVLITKND